jgi:hypothetical protein
MNSTGHGGVTATRTINTPMGSRSTLSRGVRLNRARRDRGDLLGASWTSPGTTAVDGPEQAAMAQERVANTPGCPRHRQH